MSEQKKNGSAKGWTNLVPLTKRSPEEQFRIRGNGGRKAGQNRARLKSLREELELLLEMVAEDGRTNQEHVSIALLDKALSGDVRAFETLRDTVGQRPVERQEVVDLTPRERVVITIDDKPQVEEDGAK